MTLYKNWKKIQPRLSLLGGKRKDTVNSDADMLRLIELSAQRERFAVEPDMLSATDRAIESSFLSMNGLVADSRADHVEYSKR